MNIVKQSVTQLQVTPCSELLIESAGRTCYKSEDKITNESAAKFIHSIIKSGHDSVLEHATASFRIITTRFTSHQIVRHRIMSYSQMSQRYCSYDKDKFNGEVTFIMPKDLKVESDECQMWKTHMVQSEKMYFQLLSSGCAPQVARSVLPSSCQTEIVMTGNFRSWRHFLKLRMSSHAQSDIRELAYFIQDLLEQEAPNVFSLSALEL